MSVEMRTSWDRPQACVTEASLSTMTLRMATISALPFRTAGALAGSCVEDARERGDAREAEGVGGRPLACGFTVDPARSRHEGVGRFHTLNEEIAGLELHVHLAGDARLGREQERLDVAAHGIQQLALVYQITVRLCQLLLDALLASGEGELLELAVRGEQHLRRGRLDGDASLGADDGVAEVNAAADAEGRSERLELLDDLDR